MASVELIDDAFEDLKRIRDSGFLPQVLRKLVQLETNPELGRTLAQQLHGYRRIRVGDMRIIHRASADGELVVVWLCGRRRDQEAYREAARRLDAIGPDPHARTLRAALDDLTK